MIKRNIFAFLVLIVGLSILFYINRQPLHIFAQNVPAAPATEKATPPGEKIPDDIGLRIRNNQLDQARIQNQMAQMAQQYQADQAAITHDQQEMVSLKHEALNKANKDVDKWDVDEEKLVYIPKPPAPKPEAKK